MKLFVSCSSYLLGQVFSPREGTKMLQDACADVLKPAPVAAVEAIRALRDLADLTLRVDCGATHIGKTRSRHFNDALKSECDAWLTIDDDVTATKETLAALLECVSVSEPRICIAPCLLRASDVVNVEWEYIVRELRMPSGNAIRNAVRGGFGLVAMNRAALESAANVAPSWLDDDGSRKLAPFLETLSPGGKWLGEDLAFFARLPPRVEVWALTTGATTHAGATLNLADVP